MKIWLPPMLTLLGTLIVVVFTAWLNNRAIFAHMEALRQETRATIAEALAPINLSLARIENKVDHLADMVASHSERLDKLEGGCGK